METTTEKAVAVWDDRTSPAALVLEALKGGTGQRFPRLVDGVEVEIRWEQPAPGDGGGARATWAVYEGGSKRTGGHLGLGPAVKAYREGRAFDAWWKSGGPARRVLA